MLALSGSGVTGYRVQTGMVAAFPAATSRAVAPRTIDVIRLALPLTVAFHELV